ncbi:hypothetical protein T11_17469 [Trichinella zimbabwensis]|uniref:Uncharacterized protein n=1 Tax=Trichinella zimbabwensis TaxID=268475 RepID=A0A0V1GSQ2_9BILA|nr:hypothetical protein T11_17469 [Trichinella zimbabwensis]
MSTRRRDRVSEKEPARSDGERTGADPEETNQPTPPGGSLHHQRHAARNLTVVALIVKIYSVAETIILYRRQYSTTL